MLSENFPSPDSDESEGKAAPDSNQELLDRGRRTLERFIDRWSDHKKQEKLDIQCVTNEYGPWPEEEVEQRTKVKGQERPCLHEDVLSQYIHQVVNQGEMNPVSYDVQPGAGITNIAGDDEQAKRAEELGDRIRAMDEESNAVYARLRGLENAVRSGIGVWFLDTEDAGGDGFDDNIISNPVMDPLAVWLDPDSKKMDWADQNDCFEEFRLSRAEFKDKYPRAKAVDFDTYRTSMGDNWFGEDTVRLCIWRRRQIVSESDKLIVDDGLGDGKGTVVDSTELKDGEAPKVLSRRRKVKYKVFKTLMTGAEILENVEWPDSEEIPCLVCTGPMKFMDGKRIVESLVRKGRPGQLRYDVLISTITELILLTPKPKYIGHRGQFDNNSPWDKAHKVNVAYLEAELVTDQSTGKPLPLPHLEKFEPPIAALEAELQTTLIGIQNALGMQSTERKDRAAKSGKALDKLDEQTQVGTFHFFKSWRMAAQREGRIKLRMVKKLEVGARNVSFRDKTGKHRIGPITENYWEGEHQLIVSEGPSYQSQREMESDFADSLAKLDPALMSAFMPALIALKGSSPGLDTFKKIAIAMAPPQVQAVLNGDEAPDPRTEQAVQLARQFHDQCTQLEETIKTMKLEEQAKKHELASKERIAADNNKTTILNTLITTSAKEDLARLEAVIDTAAQRLDQQYNALEGHLGRMQEIGMSGLAHDQNRDLSEQTHGQNLEAGAVAHEQGLQASEVAHQQGMEAADQGQQHALEQGQQAADLAPQPQAGE